jgi:uncharacterized protein (TIGR02270 family)
MNSVLEALVENSVILWMNRERVARAPHARLVRLVEFDERVAAHLDALRIAGAAARPLMAKELEWGAPGVFFVAAWLHLMGSANDDTEPSFPPGPLTAALAWGDAAHAADAIRLEMTKGDEAKAVAIAAIGARRSDPGSALTAALADPSPLIRARAYRTTGQLGRHDLMAQLRPGLTDDDPECRFWSAWAACRMGAGEEALGVLAEIAWTNQPRAVRALDLLLRCLEVPHANAWLREFAKLPDRKRDLIRATGVVGDPVYIPWLIERMVEPETARLAGEAFSMITGLDLAYRDLDRKQPADFESGPNDDPADENVALDEDENLPWPDPGRIGSWWLANLARYSPGTTCFLGAPKQSANWLEALSDAFQRQRHAAALELAIRMPRAAMFEVRARGRLQRRLIARSRGLA